jgi:hypothetical protein
VNINECTKRAPNDAPQNPQRQPTPPPGLPKQRPRGTQNNLIVKAHSLSSYFWHQMGTPGHPPCSQDPPRVPKRASRVPKSTQRRPPDPPKTPQPRSGSPKQRPKGTQNNLIVEVHASRITLARVTTFWCQPCDASYAVAALRFPYQRRSTPC